MANSKNTAEELYDQFVEVGAIAPTGYEKHKRIIVEGIASEINRQCQVNKQLISALRSLCLVVSDDIDDYPDASAYRQVQDKVNIAQAVLSEAGRS